VDREEDAVEPRKPEDGEVLIDGEYLKRESLVRGETKDQIQPYISSFDAKGQMTIGW